MRSVPLAVALLAIILFSGGHWPSGIVIAAGGSTLSRPEDPAVLTGADVPSLLGIAPHDLVAFRYDGTWTQIPVQVDERDFKTFTTVYNGTVNSSVTELFYTDPATWTGADSDPTIDNNDEVAFMSGDAGGQPPSFAQPPSTVANSGVEVAISDPLAPSQQGWVYLFRSDGSLDPAAGQSYVTYTFSLNSGDYKTSYTRGDTHPALAGNPENSTITTPNYSYHFGDRWQEDQMKISGGGATNVDILDRHKPMFAPGSCVRTEDTFDGYIDTAPIEGAFVANKSGPVRAIRSFVGANSGPRTQRDEIFYAQRQEIRTALRVHAIPSILDFFDYSPAASGMTYYNDLNTSGVTIDGVPDNPTLGAIQWQMVTGAQGTVVTSGVISTNIPNFTYTSYYLDHATPSGTAETQCTGDASAYGSSGIYVNKSVPCTDPGLVNCPNYLDTTSVMYYEAPQQTVSRAQTLAAQATTPLAFTAQPWVPSGQDSDNDGCTDAKELGPDWHLGGQRDPNSPWDFFDVPTPAGPATGADGRLILSVNATRNNAITLSDVSVILSYVGRTASNTAYTQDNNGDGTADGQQLDRSPSTDATRPWRSGGPNGAITLQDASVALAQVGTNCN